MGVFNMLVNHCFMLEVILLGKLDSCQEIFAFTDYLFLPLFIHLRDL